MAETVWYCQIGDRILGPITSDQLIQMSRSGQLRPDDLVRSDQADAWIPAREIAGLEFNSPSFAPASSPGVSSHRQSRRQSRQATYENEKIIWCLVLGVFAALIAVDRYYVLAYPMFSSNIDLLRKEAAKSYPDVSFDDRSDREFEQRYQEVMTEMNLFQRVATLWKGYLFATLGGAWLGWIVTWFIGARPSGSSFFGWLEQLA